MPLCPTCKDQAEITKRERPDPGPLPRLRSFLGGLVTAEDATETVVKECDRCDARFEGAA